MNICSCTNTLFVSKPFNPCEENLEIPARAEEDGVHTLVLWFLSSYITIPKHFDLDEMLSFPLKGLNEDFEFLAAVQQPTRGQLIIAQGETTFNCFKFRTALKKTFNAAY